MSAPSVVRAQSSCNGAIEISYVSVPIVSTIGSIIRVHIDLGAGSIGGGMQLSLSQVLFDLDCTQGSIPGACTNDGNAASYGGDSTITTTCVGVTWTSNNAAGGVSPNEVQFNASIPVIIPKSTPKHCAVEFDIEVAALSGDATPNAIEQRARYGSGTCDTSPPLSAAGTATGSIGAQPQINKCIGVTGILREFPRR